MKESLGVQHKNRTPKLFKLSKLNKYETKYQPSSQYAL
jgi:hypothetical protein